MFLIQIIINISSFYLNKFLHNGTLNQSNDFQWILWYGHLVNLMRTVKQLLVSFLFSRFNFFLQLSQFVKNKNVWTSELPNLFILF